MAPEPVRGRRNDSRNIAHVAVRIGELWDMAPQQVLDLTAANARRVFGAWEGGTPPCQTPSVNHP